jgi:polyisoprenoid-binding protein YceI
MQYTISYSSVFGRATHRRKLGLTLGTTTSLLALVAIVSLWWFAIRQDAQLATSAPAIPASLVNTSGTATPQQLVSAAGMQTGQTFQVDSSLSGVDYFVEANVLSVASSTIKLSTDQIAGAFYITGDNNSVVPAPGSQFTVNLQGLTDDAGVQQALGLDRYPNATFTVATVAGYDSSLPAGAEQALQISGTLMLHGVEKQVTWDVKVRREGNVISMLATLKVSLSDYGIAVSKLSSLASVQDQGTFQIQLIATAAS